MKTFWFLFALLLALTLVQCTDNSVIPVQDEFVTKGPGGGGHTTTTTNNLSTPTIMVKGSFTGVTATDGDDLVQPTGGLPLTGYEVPGYYYVQGVHKWQCDATSVETPGKTATAEWGDNLAGDAKLKVGQPIRVELGLFDDQGLEMQGFNVIKLEPSKLDRESAYGTLATPDGNGGYFTTAEMLPARVFDGEVTFSVKNVGTGQYVVPEGTNPTAEINATGKVVYGYNLRVTSIGTYEITFTIPNVDITGVDAGTFTFDQYGPDKVTLVINVIAGGSGGGGGH